MAGPETMQKELQGTLNRFEPLNLQQLESVQLMNRIDTKYILSLDQLKQILPSVSGDYKILEELDTRQFTYKNLYFDTPGLDMFNAHHNGKSVRYKIRLREYTDFGYIFLEIKKKKKGRTIKQRIRLDDNACGSDGFNDCTGLSGMGGRIEQFTTEYLPYSIESLRPFLLNSFNRFTLVHRDMNSRITIDSFLSFRNGSTGISEFSNLAVLEVKYDASSSPCPIRKKLKQEGIRPGSMSKYCIGSVSISPILKYNNFKPTILNIKRIEYGTV